MKKIIILGIIAIFIANQVNAQITFGIKGGFNLASIRAVGGDEDLGDSFNDRQKWLPAFHGGVTADIPLSEKIIIQPALQFIKKGGKEEAGSEFKARRIFNYLELPVNVLYRQSSAGGFYGGIGPYIGYALNGKAISKQGDEPEQKINYNFDEDGSKRFDAGANFMVGYELPAGITLGANYSLGLTSILNPDKNEGISTKNSYIGISIGYKFKK